MFTVVSSSNKVDATVNANNIADIEVSYISNFALNKDMQKILAMLVNKFGSTKTIDIVVKIFLHTSFVIRKLYSAGVSEMIRIWLNNNCQEKPEEMAQIIYEEYRCV